MAVASRHFSTNTASCFGQLYSALGLLDEGRNHMSIFRKFKALLGSGNDSSSSSELSQEIVGVIQAYGKVLEERSLSSSIVVDSKHLPFSKEKIKEAIFAALCINKDPAQRKNLATGFIFLADFQDGVGDAFVGLDFGGLNPTNDNIKELAKTISKQQPAFESWNPIIESEKALLLAELKSAGYDE